MLAALPLQLANRPFRETHRFSVEEKSFLLLCVELVLLLDSGGKFDVDCLQWCMVFGSMSI